MKEGYKMGMQYDNYTGGDYEFRYTTKKTYSTNHDRSAINRLEKRLLSYAEEIDRLKKENGDIKQRVEELEAEANVINSRYEILDI